MPTIQKVVLRNVYAVYRARPAYVVAEPEDTIRFLNVSDRSIVLSFPNGPFASGATIAPGGGWEATIPSNAAAGFFAYVGTVIGLTDTTVQGESSPEIIIDRFGSSQPIPKVPTAR